MTISVTTGVVVPVSGNYLVTVNGNCNGGPRAPASKCVSGLLTTAGPIHLQSSGGAGNPSLAGRGTPCTSPPERRLAMAPIRPEERTVHCGATLDVSARSTHPDGTVAQRARWIATRPSLASSASPPSRRAFEFQAPESIELLAALPEVRTLATPAAVVRAWRRG